MGVIPDRYFAIGDINRAKTLTGYAKRQMRQLKQDMAFRGLKTLSSEVRFSDGVVIRCASSYGENKGYIYVPEYQGPDEPGDMEECFCGCNFALGYIVSESVGTPSWPDENRRYDVIVCNKKQKYLLFQYCLPSDHLDWESEAVNYSLADVSGMPVIVLLENNRTDAKLCCPYETTGNVTNITQTACNPDIPATVDPNQDTAVPFYRIVPVFSSFVKKWSKVQAISNVQGKSEDGLLQDT